MSEGSDIISRNSIAQLAKSSTEVSEVCGGALTFCFSLTILDIEPAELNGFVRPD